jgi:hypothetical protein
VHRSLSSRVRAGDNGRGGLAATSCGLGPSAGTPLSPLLPPCLWPARARCYTSGRRRSGCVWREPVLHRFRRPESVRSTGGSRPDWGLNLPQQHVHTARECSKLGDRAGQQPAPAHGLECALHRRDRLLYGHDVRHPMRHRDDAQRGVYLGDDRDGNARRRQLIAYMGRRRRAWDSRRQRCQQLGVPSSGHAAYHAKESASANTNAWFAQRSALPIA